MDLPSGDSSSAGVPTGGGGVAPTEMELRVERALILSAPVDLHGEQGLVMARAAIRAMGVPISEDMAHAAVQLNICDEMDAAEIWQAMIDAASPGPR